jgi:hypothetical protein
LSPIACGGADESAVSLIAVAAIVGRYIQMSGRAGRRGLDDRGVVILMLDTRLEPAAAKDMLRGAPDTLNSEFQLGCAPPRVPAPSAPRRSLSFSYY